MKHERSNFLLRNGISQGSAALQEVFDGNWSVNLWLMDDRCFMCDFVDGDCSADASAVDGCVA